jgi:cytidylate kinase
MIVTLDGPAGTGKSTVARAVAQRLGFDFLDTGAMYRAIGLEAVRREADLDDPRELAFIAQHCRIEFDWQHNPPAVLLNGEVVTHLLRSGEATRAASYVATVPAIRERLVEQQRAIGRGHPGLVTEGRDQGSVVFPDAAFKFYLDADPAERARRRARQLRDRGEIVEERAIYDEMLDRDRRDTGRAVAPLIVPPDAIHIDTTGLSEEEVISRIVQTVRRGGK